MTRHGSGAVLTVFDDVPKGCTIFPVKDAYSEPHLHLGEFAVVDPTDRDPEHGELFLIQWQSGRRAIHQVMCGAFNDRENWGIYDLVRPRGFEEASAWLKEGRDFHTGASPLSLEHLTSKLVGRVVGVYGP